jgi:hypothetical protein
MADPKGFLHATCSSELFHERGTATKRKCSYCETREAPGALLRVAIYSVSAGCPRRWLLFMLHTRPHKNDYVARRKEK